MKANKRITVVIPAYRVAKHIADVLEYIPDFVDHIIVVDDACPEQSGRVAQALAQARVEVINHVKNLGVGGAVKTGYQRALALNSDIVVKMDGDGQMDGKYIAKLIEPLLSAQYDYTKGNRFHDLSALAQMPKLRLFGNSVLSFITKLVSGYWNILDSTNGFTAIRSEVLVALPLGSIADQYFFETDMLVHLYIQDRALKDVLIPAHYGKEQSSMRISQVLLDFPPKVLARFAKRIFYRYFLYDFNMASVYLIIGLPLLLFGVSFGAYSWVLGVLENTHTAAGTVMLAAMPVILGVQFLLQAIHIDINNVPKVR